MRQDSDDLPLDGIRVVEMATLGMGPIAAQTLGDYGADVVKLESVAGDLFRHITPAVSADMGHTFIHLNRNKRSLALDVKSARGQELVRALLGSADVFLSNTRPIALRKLGLDHASLCAANPGLIHCTAHGFSEQGPYAGRPAADDTIQAMSGLVDLQQRAGGQPMFVASVVADKAVGLMIVNAILAALLRRSKTGTGQSIEVPMFESMVAFLMPEHMAGKTYTPQRGAPGYARIVNPKRRPFRTADGLICVLPYTDDQWRRFFELIDRPDLVADAELATQIGRSCRFEELYAIIEEVMPRHSTSEWDTATDRHRHPVRRGQHPGAAVRRSPSHSTRHVSRVRRSDRGPTADDRISDPQFRAVYRASPAAPLDSASTRWRSPPNSACPNSK